MLLERVILPSQAVAGRRLIIHYVSRHIIFHDLIPTNKSKGKGILRHKRRAPGSCLNSCVAWAITLTERRSARFAFSGTLMPFPSITRNPTGGAIVEHLPLINCSSWACTQDFDALREVREQRGKSLRSDSTLLKTARCHRSRHPQMRHRSGTTRGKHLCDIAVNLRLLSSVFPTKLSP